MQHIGAAAQAHAVVGSVEQQLGSVAGDSDAVVAGPNAKKRWRDLDSLYLAGEAPIGIDHFLQYQQRPIPLEGNLVKRSWIKSYDKAPERNVGTKVVQSWDVASTTGNTNDWSVCTTWIVVKRNYYLIDVWRGRLEFPELRRRSIVLAQEHKPNTILIEQAGPGLHLIQEFRANPIPGVPVPIGIKPEGEKLVRMEAQSARFEAGQVHFPREASWLDELLHELLAFPNARHDDQIDSVSQLLNWAEAHAQPVSFGEVIVFTTPRDLFDCPPYW